MPPLTPGVELTGRYLVDRQLFDDGVIETWTATDRVLARVVEVELLRPGASDAEREAFLVSAAAVARLSHPGIVNAYDTGVSAEGMPYLVTERAVGPTLADLLVQHGPLSPSRVVVIGQQVARALDIAHCSGVVHGAVSPSTVQVSRDDRAKLTGFTGSGMRWRLAGSAPDAGDDVDGCASTLVGALLGALPLSPSADPVSPRSLRPGIPPSLDAVLVAAQRGGWITSAADLADHLGRLDVSDDARPDLDNRPTPPVGTRVVAPPVRIDGGRTGAVAGVVVGLLLAAAVAVAAFVLFGRGGSPSSPVPGEPASTTVLATPSGTPLAIVGAHSFDPFGDHTEMESMVGNVRDGDPATIWSTEEYKTAHFGGLKPGVGVILLLDSVRSVRQLTVTSPSREWTFDVYVAAQPAADLAGWGTSVVSGVTVVRDSTTVDLKTTSGAAVLVWITDLGPPLAHPPDPATPYRVDIGELQVR
jgi:eukaryotic-like serine/threonine-protein kinase